LHRHDWARALAAACLALSCGGEADSRAGAASSAPSIGPPVASAPVAPASAAATSRPCVPPTSPRELEVGFKTKGWPITSLDLSSDGCRLVVSNGFAELVVIDVARWSTIGAIQLGISERQISAGFVDAKRIVFCGTDGALHLWDGIDEPTRVAPLRPEMSPAGCRGLAVDRAAGRVAIVSFADVVRPRPEVHVVDLEGHELARRWIPGPYRPALSGDWFTSVDPLATGADARRFVAWAANELPSKAWPDAARFRGLGVGPEMLAVGPSDILRVEEPTRPSIRELPREHGFPRTGSFSPDGSVLAVFHQKAGARGTQGVALYAWPELRELGMAPMIWASDYVWTDDGRMVAATEGMRVHFLDGRSAAELGVGGVGSE
jgi:hypothetical protein